MGREIISTYYFGTHTGGTGGTGNTGSSGGTGGIGNTGGTGPQGLQGNTGGTGSQGQIGPTGGTGPQGLQGPIGERGPQGETGSTGGTGGEGLQGNTGGTGSQGQIGPTGGTGPQGLQGPVGERGPQGETGGLGGIGPQGFTGGSGGTGGIGPIGLTGPGGTDSLFAQLISNDDQILNEESTIVNIDQISQTNSHDNFILSENELTVKSIGNYHISFSITLTNSNIESICNGSIILEKCNNSESNFTEIANFTNYFYILNENKNTISVSQYLNNDLENTKYRLRIISESIPNLTVNNIYFLIYNLRGGDTGGTGASILGGTFEYTINEPAFTWLFKNELGTQRPIIQCFDLNNNVIYPNSIYISDDQTIQINWSVPTSGIAKCISGGGLTGGTGSSTGEQGETGGTGGTGNTGSIGRTGGLGPTGGTGGTGAPGAFSATGGTGGVGYFNLHNLTIVLDSAQYLNKEIDLPDYVEKVSVIAINGILVNLNYDYTIIDHKLKFNETVYLEIGCIITILYSTEYMPDQSSLSLLNDSISNFGTINIPSNAINCQVIFDHQIDENYLCFISINSKENSKIVNYLITNKTAFGFNVLFDKNIETDDYSLDWVIVKK